MFVLRHKNHINAFDGQTVEDVYVKLGDKQKH